MKARQLLMSWDLWLALAGASGAALCLPEFVSCQMARDLYEMGITVLSIVFAVFFTALAIIIAAGDDDFIIFLREIKVYGPIMWSFVYTLWLLFGALMYSVVSFACSVIASEGGWKFQSKWFVVVFAMLFLYSLFAVIGATRDSIKWAQGRIDYTEQKRGRQEKDGASEGDAGGGAAQAPPGS